MEERKNVKVKIIHKYELEVDWNKSSYVPDEGEFVCYAIEVDEDGKVLCDSNGKPRLPEGRDWPYTYERLKLGDGIKMVSDLPFYGSGIIDVVELPNNESMIDSNKFYRLLTATFIHNRHTVDNSVCYCVTKLPEVGNPATDGKGSVRAYYNLTDGQVYGYLNSDLGAMFGIPAGWYLVDTLFPAQGWVYGGVISDMNGDPKDSTIRVLLQYSMYHYKDGKWMLLSDFDVNEWLYPAMIRGQGHWIYSYNNLDLKNPFPATVFSSYQLNPDHEVQIPERKNGIIKAAAPIEEDDVTNKAYVDNAVVTVQETTIPRLFTKDESNGHNRVYYIKNPVLTGEEKFPTTEETSYILPSGKSAIVRAIPTADSGYMYESDWSYIDENGNPLEPSVPIAWEGALPTPIVTKISSTEISWSPIEGAKEYELIIGTPTKYGGDGSFANSHNRVIAEMSRGRGIYSRYTISPNPFGAKDPDPEDYALNKRMDTIPLRMDDGFLRVPVSTYGTIQPVIGDDNYDENQRAMSKQYIDSGIQAAKDYATDCKTQANDYADSKLVDAKTYSDNNLDKAKKYTDSYNNSNNQYGISTLKQQSNVLQVVGNATDYKANALITNIASMEGTGKYSCFSTDLKCITERTSGVLATLLFGEYVFGLTLRADNGNLLINQFSSTNTGSEGTGNDNICSVPLNEWFNLKVKYYQNAENSQLSIYINDKVVAKDIICYYQTPIPITEINRVRFRYSNVAVTFQFDNVSLVKSNDENMPYTNKVATFEDGNIISNTSGVNYITHSNSTNSSKLDMISVVSEDIKYVPLANEKGELHGEVSENSNDKVLVNKGYVNSLVGDINSALEAINAQINTFKGV